MKGNIDWQGRTATEAAGISAPITIQQGENLITEAGGSLTLVFQNACSLNFSEKTEIDIIQTLPADIVFSQSAGWRSIQKPAVTHRYKDINASYGINGRRNYFQKSSKTHCHGIC